MSLEIVYKIQDLQKRMFENENYIRVATERVGHTMKQSTSLPHIYYDEDLIRRELDIANLPEQLRTFWSCCSSLVMNYVKSEGLDIEGIYIYSPDQALVRHRHYYVKEKELTKTTEDIQKGDLIIGEYIGEQQYVLIRCDENCNDFGSILMTQPIDPREEWPIVGTSLVDFLETYYSAGEKFWDNEKYWRN